MSDQTAPLTGAQHFAKAAEILAQIEEESPDPVENIHFAGNAHRIDALQRAALHVQLAQASATVHCQGDRYTYSGYGEPR
mgnify:CR=1 FL=1